MTDDRVAMLTGPEKIFYSEVSGMALPNRLLSDGPLQRNTQPQVGGEPPMQEVWSWDGDGEGPGRWALLPLLRVRPEGGHR